MVQGLYTLNRSIRELDQKNYFRHGIVGGAFLSIQATSPETADGLVDKVASFISQKSSLPYQDLPIRDEQYRLQLEVLKNPQAGDVELVSLPAFMTWLACKCSV